MPDAEPGKKRLQNSACGSVQEDYLACQHLTHFYFIFNGEKSL